MSEVQELARSLHACCGRVVDHMEQLIKANREIADLQAENARLSAELARAREAMRKARDYQTPTGGSFRQWYDEIVGILDAALAAKEAK